MATEEQTNTGAHAVSLRSGGATRAGQRLYITNRTVSKLSFPLKKNNSPTGNVTFVIRQTDDTILATKVLGDASALSATLNWEEVTFDTPVFINEEVRILAEYSGGDATDNVAFYGVVSDVKADEYWTVYSSSTWQPQTGWDAPYIYTYAEEGSAAPLVTTLACTDVIATSATGNGNIWSLGTSAVTQHGHCWHTSDPPSTSNSKTQNGAIANKGPFSSSITGLTPGTKYYVRAYATNTTGTSYGVSVEIAGDVTTIGKRHWWVAGDEFHFFGYNDVHYKVRGTEDTTGLPWWYYT